MFYTILPIGVFWSVSLCFYALGLDFDTNVNQVSKRQVVTRTLQLNALHILSSLPLEYDVFFERPKIFRWYYFIFGILLLDTLEYFLHYMYHKIPFLYKYCHVTHHEMKMSWSFGALYNSLAESIISGGIISCFFFCVFHFSIVEFSLVTSVAILWTCMDHCDYFKSVYWLGRKNYHARHHLYKTGNYQQPFFTFWDHVWQTKIPTTHQEVSNFKPGLDMSRLAFKAK